SPEQKAAFEAGQAVKMENLQFRDGTKRSAYLQVSAVERGLEFLPRAAVQFLQQGQQPAEQQVAGLKDGKGVEFNGHVQPGAQGSPEQKAAFEAGQAVKMENLQFRDGTKRSAYLQV
ncbi:DUF3945 domain-containing protein, partial [Bacteroides fragilis]